jgi:hypothetical protein
MADQFLGEWADRNRNSNSKFLSIEDETILDWTYPVHILSTKAAAAHRGRYFRDVRQSLYCMARYNPQIENLDSNNDVHAATQLTRMWVAERSSEKMQSRDLFSPHERLLKMLETNKFRLQGVKCTILESLVGYSLWERPSSRGTTANLFACVGLKEYKGLSAYLVVEACRILSEDKITYVNLGGSETNGLDRHKRFFSPVKTLEIVSIVVQSNDGGAPKSGYKS